MRKQLVLVLSLVGCALMPVVAQDKPQPTAASTPPAATGAARQIPLKVQLTLSRFMGEKKISSIPYVLGVLTNAQKTNLRMGVQVPVTTTVFGGGQRRDYPAKQLHLSRCRHQHRLSGTRHWERPVQSRHHGRGLHDQSRSIAGFRGREEAASRYPLVPLVPRQLCHGPARWADDAVRVGDRSDQRRSDADRRHVDAGQIVTTGSATPAGRTTRSPPTSTSCTHRR